MKIHILTRIEEMEHSFSKSQKKIAKYIKEHYDKAAFMTAAKLGQTVEVSESTVVRFAMELGFEGYPELQKALTEMVRTKLTSTQRIEVCSSLQGNEEIIDTVVNGDLNKIRSTLENVDRKAFNAATDVAANARKIYIIGVRSSAPLADVMYFYFNMLFGNAVIVGTSSETEMFEQMLRINEQDVVVSFSFPRYSKRAVEAVKFAREKGAKVVAFTDIPESPISQYADFLLLVKSEIAFFVDSIAAPLTLINAFVVQTAMNKKDEVSKTFSQLENIWDQHQFYEEVDEFKK